MRKLKDCFHMILTAVICFAVNLFSRKPDNSAEENKVFLSCMKKSRKRIRIRFLQSGRFPKEGLFLAPGSG